MSFDGTQTSRRALIIGMTNTDQVGMQQAKAPAAATIPDHAERIPDAGDGAAPDPGELNDIGLTADEQAEFDRMAQPGDDAPDPAGDAPADGDEEHEDEPDLDPAAALAPGAPDPAAVEKTPAQLAAEAAAGQKPPPKTVSYGKYQRDLKKAQDIAAASTQAAQKARDDAIKLAERVAIINEALAAQPAAAAVAPDPNAPPANPFDEPDILATDDYAAAVDQIQRRQRFQMEQQGRVEQTVTESNEDRALRDTFTRDFQTLAASPEGQHLPAAYQFLKDARLTQICLSEFDKDPNDPAEQFTPAEVQRMVQVFNNEEKWLVGNAIKNKKSPAAAIMKQARVYGFKPPAAAAPPPAPPAARVPVVRNGNGAPPAAAAAAPSAAAVLAELAEAQAAGKSLSDGGGAPPPVGITAKMLVDMNDDEFAEFLDGMSATEQRQFESVLGRVPG